MADIVKDVELDLDQAVLALYKASMHDTPEIYEACAQFMTWNVELHAKQLAELCNGFSIDCSIDECGSVVYSISTKRQGFEYVSFKGTNISAVIALALFNMRNVSNDSVKFEELLSQIKELMTQCTPR